MKIYRHKRHKELVFFSFYEYENIHIVSLPREQDSIFYPNTYNGYTALDNNTYTSTCAVIPRFIQVKDNMAVGILMNGFGVSYFDIKEYEEIKLENISGK